ncbi:DinB family protein [Chitinophaga nivalis]|uniref:DinB family protein n=1 Tax=Chitinophaga nivalis TaxID=2991709 RepID=A0ABT3IL17_9BACT|nr:DinB family protein [Chitinophaga nivalis]MCW3465656.1 DinB family protein [Chitinophaga nivalis]MCW3484653.1 DinB family protein [Chitinophaga nivalis]
MLSSILINLFERDMSRLEEEIAAYETEAAIWRVPAGIHNSAGNLCLHLCGNLQHFVGAVLGKTDYVRNRELEFSAKNVPRQDMLTQIGTTRRILLTVIVGLTPEEMEKPYPEKVLSGDLTVGHFLVHLSTHLNYHLGQINYHRRLTQS